MPAASATRPPGIWTGLASLILLLAASACSVRLIADRDAATEQVLYQLAAKVDRFYLRLQGTAETERTFQASAGDYQDIEADLRSLVLRNRVRPLNDDSTRIAEILLELWQDTMKAHRTSDAYQDFDLEEDWRELRNVISYALEAEGAKPPPGS